MNNTPETPEKVNTRNAGKGHLIINYSLFIIHYSLSRNVSYGVSGAPSEVKSELSAEFSISSIVMVLLPSL